MGSMTKEKRAEYDLARYHRRRAEGIEILGGKCVRCNSTEQLEFDHIDPTTKELSIGKMWGVARERWLRELMKCQLLCKPCHTKKSTKEAMTELHGAWGMVKKKCKCEKCRLFQNAYIAEWKRNKRAAAKAAV
jgi:5-methylcytosine-specific restriction endonuclease McrA